MAAFVAEHSLPFTITDHLVKLLPKICKDSKIAKGIVSGRTKTQGVVKNVIGNQHMISICNNLRQQKFSLIVDESTDISSIKHLCLVVRYANQQNKIEDHFFTLIPLLSSDATTLYNKIIAEFKKYEIPYKENLIGFASDGANVMMGGQHSLMIMLKNDIPSLFTMKCICHSFHLCASYACMKIPNTVESLIRDIYNFFSSSPKRQLEFREFQKFCNIKIHKMLHPAQTRWLSMHMAVSRILEQYEALRLYFTDAVANNDALASQSILEKLNEGVTKLFLQFLDFILPVFNNLNKDMQAESPRIHILYKNVCSALRTIYDCFLKRDYILRNSIEDIDFKNPRNWMAIEDCYFGANVNNTIAHKQFSNAQLLFFRQRCLDFFVEACSQIAQRFPLKNNNIQLLDFVDPVKIKQGNIQSISNVAILFPNFIQNDNLQELDTRWRMLRNLEEIQELPNDLDSFWQTIKKIKSGDGTETFCLLTKFVSHILCLPHSSANVERIFSLINLLKTKQRNTLNTDTIIGLLHCKDYLKNDQCYNFEVDRDLILLMRKDIIYKTDE